MPSFSNLENGNVQVDAEGGGREEDRQVQYGIGKGVEKCEIVMITGRVCGMIIRGLGLELGLGLEIRILRLGLGLGRTE